MNQVIAEGLVPAGLEMMDRLAIEAAEDFVHAGYPREAEAILLCEVDGVTEEEAAWQAACYAADDREEGWPAPGTVAWQAAHVAHCKRYYTRILERVGEADPPEAEPWTPLATYAEIRAALAAHTNQPFPP